MRSTTCVLPAATSSLVGPIPILWNLHACIRSFFHSHMRRYCHLMFVFLFLPFILPCAFIFFPYCEISMLPFTHSPILPRADTAFMFIIGGLFLVKTFQTRHPDIHTNAFVAFFSFAVVIFFTLLGIVGLNINYIIVTSLCSTSSP